MIRKRLAGGWQFLTLLSEKMKKGFSVPNPFLTFFITFKLFIIIYLYNNYIIFYYNMSVKENRVFPAHPHHAHNQQGGKRTCLKIM